MLGTLTSRIRITSSCSFCVQNDIIRQAFVDSRCISAVASEEEDEVEHIDAGSAASSSGAASSDSGRYTSGHELMVASSAEAMVCIW